MKDIDPAQGTKMRVAHLCANLSYAGLLGLVTLWSFIREPGFAPLLWALACVPLLILWPSMRRRRHRAYSWLCFVVLPYFVVAVEGSMSSIGSWIHYSILIMTVVVFVSAMLTSRWLQRSAAQPASENDSQG